MSKTIAEKLKDTLSFLKLKREYKAVESVITNCHCYTEGMQPKIAFDVVLYNKGTDLINFGNSTLCFNFMPGQISNIGIKPNVKYSAGNYEKPEVKIVADKILLIQFRTLHAGGIVDPTNEGELLVTVIADTNGKAPLITWRRMDTAIVDVDLGIQVNNSYDGGCYFGSHGER